MDSVIIEIRSTGDKIKATVVSGSPSKSENFLMDLEEILMIKWDCPYQLFTHYEGTWKVRLNYYRESNFLTKSVVQALAEENKKLFSDYTFGQGYYVGESKDELFPTIHVFSSNVFSLNMPLFPRYSAIMDSSIWNFYYSKEEALIEKSRKNSETNVLLLDFFGHIIRYYSEGRYDLCIAREFVEFNARMVRNSYFLNSKGPKLKGHGSFVSPFIFHRELDSYNRIQEEYLDGVLVGYKWRLLLVDDFSKVPLKIYDNHSGNRILNKCDIICRDIWRVFPNVKICYTDDCELYYDASINSTDFPLKAKKEDDYDIIIHRVTTIDGATEALNDRKYEVILLDYLLGLSIDQGDSVYHREYGYQLLDAIRNGQVTKGPLGEQYIMFISAFTTAINEKLLAKHWTWNEKDYWHIGQGACPTNTVNLFLFYLLRLMKRRVDSVPTTETIGKILLEIFSESQDGQDSVRSKARARFNDLFTQKAMISQVYSETSSRFYSNIAELSGIDEAFWDHLFHLIYLVAYCSVRQWEEMWEEYIFLQSTLDKMMNNDKADNSISKLILGYISKLRDMTM